MSIEVNDNINNASNKDIDDKKGVYQGGVWRPYNNSAEVFTKVPYGARYKGLIVLISVAGSATEFWFRNGLNDGDLIEKIGASSEPGPKGDQGDQGVPGPPGPKGDIGNTGSQGSQGVKGDTGNTGPKGDTGNTGPIGNTGPKGDTGNTGAAGTAGAKGDKGDTGNTGSQGPIGNTGPKGDKGDQGDPGTSDLPVDFLIEDIVNSDYLPEAILSEEEFEQPGTDIILNREFLQADWLDKEYTTIQPLAGASTSVAFAKDNIQGTVASPLSGNITFNATGAIVGVTALILHNNGSAPSFGSEFKNIYGAYVPGVLNYIDMQYLSATNIRYTIHQNL